MPRRRFARRQEAEDGYVDCQCPDCGAPLTVRFQRGRSSRRLLCPVCKNTVIIALEEEDPTEPPSGQPPPHLQ